MLETIKNFFVGLADVITSLINFVISLISDIVYIVKLTTTFVAKIPHYLNWLPASVVALIVVIFAVVVIYKILGREG